MHRWLFLLGGPLIWAAHFLFAYAIASISVVAIGETTFTARALIIAAGAGAGLGDAVLAFTALRMRRDDPLDAFSRGVALTGALISLIAVVWQTWPAIAPL